MKCISVAKRDRCDQADYLNAARVFCQRSLFSPFRSNCPWRLAGLEVVLNQRRGWAEVSSPPGDGRPYVWASYHTFPSRPGGERDWGVNPYRLRNLCRLTRLVQLPVGRVANGGARRVTDEKSWKTPRQLGMLKVILSVARSQAPLFFYAGGENGNGKAPKGRFGSTDGSSRTAS